MPSGSSAFKDDIVCAMFLTGRGVSVGVASFCVWQADSKDRKNKKSIRDIGYFIVINPYLESSDIIAK